MTKTLSKVRETLGRKSGASGGLMITVGVLGLLAMGAATALAGDSPSKEPAAASAAKPAASRLVTQSTTTQEDSITHRVRQMIQDHMGLTGEDADAWASEMAEHMRAIHGDDVGAMLDSMDGYQGDGSGLGGMMDGSGLGGMMDGSGFGGMMDGSGFGGMMDGSGFGGMMDGSGFGGMMDGSGFGGMMGN